MSNKEIAAPTKTVKAKIQRSTSKSDVQTNQNFPVIKTVKTGNVRSTMKRRQLKNTANKSTIKTDQSGVEPIQVGTNTDLSSLSDAELLEKLSDEDSREYLLLPTDKLIAIRFNCDDMPLVEKNRTDWLRKEYVYLQALKQKLENGNLSDEEMASNTHIILEPPPISETDFMEMKIDYRQRRANPILHTQIELLELNCMVKIFLLAPLEKETKCISELKKYAGKNEYNYY